jgi:hypothetical protein
MTIWIVVGTQFNIQIAWWEILWIVETWEVWLVVTLWLWGMKTFGSDRDLDLAFQKIVFASWDSECRISTKICRVLFDFNIFLKLFVVFFWVVVPVGGGRGIFFFWILQSHTNSNTSLGHL